MFHIPQFLRRYYGAHLLNYWNGFSAQQATATLALRHI